MKLNMLTTAEYKIPRGFQLATQCPRWCIGGGFSPRRSISEHDLKTCYSYTFNVSHFRENEDFSYAFVKLFILLKENFHDHHHLHFGKCNVSLTLKYKWYSHVGLFKNMQCIEYWNNFSETKDLIFPWYMKKMEYLETDWVRSYRSRFLDIWSRFETTVYKTFTISHIINYRFGIETLVNDVGQEG